MVPTYLQSLLDNFLFSTSSNHTSKQSRFGKPKQLSVNRFVFRLCEAVEPRVFATNFAKIACLRTSIFILAIGSGLFLSAQCPSVEFMLVDACPSGGEAENEYVIFSSGAGFAVNDLVVNYAPGNNVTNQGNNDVNTNVDNFPGDPTPCGLQAGDISVYTGCANVISVGPGDNIPAGVLVIFQASANPNHITDISGLCGGGETIYVVGNSCIRLIGAFTNEGSGTRTTEFGFGAGCMESVIYDRSLLSDNNGDFFIPSTSTYGNSPNCAAPVINPPVCAAAQNETFEICVDGPVINPPGESLTPAEVLFQEPGVTTVTFHTSMAAANAGSGVITEYSGVTGSSVILFARVVYSDGCVVIGALTLVFVQPDGNAGSDGSLTLCQGETGDLLAQLGGGVSAGSFSDDDGTGVNLSNPSNVNFTGVGPGMYDFTYSANDDPGTNCPPDEAVVTVTVEATPTAVTPSTALAACYTLAPNSVSSNVAIVNNEINGGSGQTVDYFFDAAGANPLDLNSVFDWQTLDASGATQIFAQITIGNCSSAIVAVPIEVGEQFSANPAGPLTECNDGSDAAFFDLGSLSNTINGGNGEIVRFFFDASLNVPIGNIHQAFTSTVFAVVGDDPCPSNTIAINLIVADALEISCSITSNSTTATSNDGSALVQIMGGTPPYTVIVNGPGGMQSIPTNSSPLVLSNLSPGNYTVTLTDDMNCPLVGSACTFEIEIDNVCALMVDTTLVDPTCAGDMDGSISLIISGEIGPVEIQWSVAGFDDQVMATGLGAGVYSATVTDQGGSNCELIIDNITLDDPPAPSIICAEFQEESAAGASDGIAELGIVTVAGPSTVNLSGPIDTTLTNVVNGTLMVGDLPGGTYTVTLTDANMCVNTCFVTIDTDVPGCSNLNISIDTMQISCAGASDGGISITVMGNVLPITIDWDNPVVQDTLILSGLDTGLYTGTIFEGGVCPQPLSILITQPDSLLINCEALVNASGPATTDGSGQVTINGGTAPYTITLNGNGRDDTTNILGNVLVFNLLSVGSYTVGVIDSNGCAQSCELTIAQDNCPLTANFTQNNVSCAGAMDGSITLAISDNQGAVTIDWDDDTFDGMQDLTGLSPGDYNVEITDGVGCFFPIGPITITEPDTLVVNCSVAQQVTLPNGNDGSIELDISGGTGPYAIEIDLNIFPPFTIFDTVATPAIYTYDTLQSGDYTINIIDANDCTASCMLTVTDPPCPNIFFQEVITPVTCFNGDNGSIEITVLNATAPITYQWSPAQPDTNFIDGLTAGNYILVIFDANNCTAAQSFEVTQPIAAPTLSCMTLTDETTVGAADGSASVTTTSSSVQVEIIITGPTNTIDSLINGNSTTTINNLEAGNYEVALVDGSCDTLFCDFVIMPGSCALDVTAVTTDADCSQNGTITTMVTNPTGNLDYDWSDDTYDGQDNLVNVPPGVYSLTVSDGTGCVDSVTVSILKIDDEPDLMLGPTPTNICADDCIDLDLTLTGSGPFTVRLGVFASGAPGPFLVNYNNLEGDTLIQFCDPAFLTAFDSIEILEIIDSRCSRDTSIVRSLNVQQLTVIDSSGTFCATETVDFGGQTFSISNPSDTFSTPGTGIECDTTYQANFIFLSQPAIDTLDSRLCVGDSLVLGSVTFNEMMPEGETSFPGQGQGGCDSLLYVRLDVVVPPPVDTLDTTICLGDSLLIGDQQFDANQPEGLTTFPSGGAAGCDSTLYVRLAFLEPSLGFFTSTACAGDTVVVEGTPFFLQDPDGLVVIENGSVNGCDSLLAVVVTFQPTPEVELDGDATICLGDTIELEFDVTNVGSVDLQLVAGNGSPIPINGVGNGTTIELTPEFSTTYRIVAATSNNPCPVVFDDTELVTVNVNRLVAGLSPGFDQDGYQIRCVDSNDGSLNLTITEGSSPYTIEWSSGESDTTFIGGLPPNNYDVTITDSEGCIDSLSQLLQAPPPILTNVRTQGPNCVESTGLVTIDSIVGGNGFYEFSIDGVFFQTSTTFPLQLPAEPGAYTLEIIDGFDCTTSLDFVVPTTSAPQLNVPGDTMMVLGDSILVVAQVDFTPDTIFWDPPAGVSDPNSLVTYLAPEFTTYYQLTVIDSSGCRTTAGFTILVDERVPVFVPNAFSPNGDGDNDLYRIFPGPGVEEVSLFRIYDRWGNMVYETGAYPAFDTSQGWDGTLDGQPMNAAVFVYYGEVLLSDGSTAVLKGDLVLVR